MAYIPGQYTPYHVILTNQITHSLAIEPLTSAALSVNYPGLFSARYDDIATPQLILRATIRRVALIPPDFRRGVVDLAR